MLWAFAVFADNNLRPYKEPRSKLRGIEKQRAKDLNGVGCCTAVRWEALLSRK